MKSSEQTVEARSQKETVEEGTTASTYEKQCVQGVAVETRIVVTPTDQPADVCLDNSYSVLLNQEKEKKKTETSSSSRNSSPVPTKLGNATVTF